jgi:hypothetical protein
VRFSKMLAYTLISLAPCLCGAIRRHSLEPAEDYRGKWLLFLGDSSVRGLYLAFHQHVMKRFNHQPAGVMDMTLWNNGSQRYLSYGWIDVVLEEHAPNLWLEVSASAAVHNNTGGWPDARPAPDQSSHLHRPWCDKTPNVSKRSRVRLTYQQMTQTKFMPALLGGMQQGWHAAPCGGPDAIFLSLGHWDMVNSVTTECSRKWLLESLLMLRNSSRHVVYASPTHPWEMAHHACWNTSSKSECWRIFDAKDRIDNDDWGPELVDEANAIHEASALVAASLATSGVASPKSVRAADEFADGSKGESSVGHKKEAPSWARVRYFDRMIQVSSLLSTSCLSKCGSILQSWWHPPHAVNVGLLPTLLHVWFGADGAQETDARVRADGAVKGGKTRLNKTIPTRMLPEVRSQISRRDNAQCCCTKPDASSFKDKVRSVNTPTSYWAKECP